MKKGPGWVWQVGGHAGKETFHGERSPCCGFRSRCWNMLKGDEKNETETRFKPYCLNVGHSTTAFFSLKINFIEI